MKNKKTIITLTLIAIAATIILNPGLTGYSILNKDKINEVSASITRDEIITNGATFIIQSIKNPVINKTNDLLLHINNMDSQKICITQVRINGINAWNGTKCVNQESNLYLTIPYTIQKTGFQFILINYSTQDTKQEPLQFILRIEPLNEASNIQATIKVNNQEVNNELSINAQETINIELAIKSMNPSTIKAEKAILTTIIDNEQYVYEIELNNQIPSYITINRKETITSPLGKGSYELKAYLYVNNNNKQEVVTKTVKLNVQ